MTPEYIAIGGMIFLLGVAVITLSKCIKDLSDEVNVLRRCINYNSEQNHQIEIALARIEQEKFFKCQ